MPIPVELLIPRSASLMSGCNSDCECTTASYEPLCDDGLVYFSPCHAGCKDVVMGEKADKNGRMKPVCLSGEVKPLIVFINLKLN